MMMMIGYHRSLRSYVAVLWGACCFHTMQVVWHFREEATTTMGPSSSGIHHNHHPDYHYDPPSMWRPTNLVQPIHRHPNPQDNSNLKDDNSTSFTMTYTNTASATAWKDTDTRNTSSSSITTTTTATMTSQRLGDNENRNNVTDDDTVVIPLRTAETKALAQYCVQNGKGGVYIKHFRKTGGTSLYETTSKTTCRTRGLPVYASELPYFNPETFHSLGTSVYITAIRNPIDRILSLYWFEGRWPRTCSQVCENSKIKNDTNMVANLTDWIEHIYHQTGNRAKLKYIPHTSCGQWQSVENYYIRTLLGRDEVITKRFQEQKQQEHTMGKYDFFNDTLTVEHLNRAKAILASFDLVLIQEQMSASTTTTTNSSDSSNNMIRMFHSIIGGDGSNESGKGGLPENGKETITTGLKHSRKGNERANHYQPPLPSEWDRLVELNYWDMELYRYALELSDKTVQQWMMQQEQEQRYSYSSFTMDQCVKPPQFLDRHTRNIALGGPMCKDVGNFTYYRKCIQHSASKSKEHPSTK